MRRNREGISRRIQYDQDCCSSVMNNTLNVTWKYYDHLVQVGLTDKVAFK
jgi:hypothetical protein